MHDQVWILTADVLFGRMLQLEFEGWHLTARLSEQMEMSDRAEVVITDLDSAAVPPDGCYGYLIGFSRLPALSADEDARRCAMILRRPFRVSLLRREVLSRLDRVILPEQESRRDRLSLCVTADGVRCGTRTVALTPIECRLIAALLKAEGEPVPRSVLEAELLTPAEGNLAVHICTLRKKLRTGGVPAVPESVHGVGYRLIITEKS